MNAPIITLTGDQLEKMRMHSELVRELDRQNPGYVELYKSDLLSNKEWDTLTLLLEPRSENSGPLIVRSQGRSIVNPLYGVTKSSIANMMKYLMIDDETTFRQLVGAEVKPNTVANSAATNISYNYNNYNQGDNTRETHGPVGHWNYENNAPELPKKNKYHTDVVVNNNNSWNNYEEEMRAGPVRRKLNRTHRGGRKARKATRRARRT